MQRRQRLAVRLSPQKAEGITSSCRGTNSSRLAVAGVAAGGGGSGSGRHHSDCFHQQTARHMVHNKAEPRFTPEMRSSVQKAKRLSRCRMLTGFNRRR